MTGQIPPQAKPAKIIVPVTCSTCKHDDTQAHQEPCNTCGRGDEGSFTNWEPAKPEYVARGEVKKPEPKAAPIDSDSKAASDFVRNTSVPTAPDILSAAEKHMRDRAATYDKPEGERSMAQTVAVFNTFHGTSLTEAQGWHFMQILKDVRLFTRDGYHADSAEDGVAYAGLKAEAKAKE